MKWYALVTLFFAIVLQPCVAQDPADHSFKVHPIDEAPTVKAPAIRGLARPNSSPLAVPKSPDARVGQIREWLTDQMEEVDEQEVVHVAEQAAIREAQLLALEKLKKEGGAAVNVRFRPGMATPLQVRTKFQNPDRKRKLPENKAEADEATARAFLGTYRDLFLFNDPGQELDVVNHWEDDLQMRHIRFSQTLKGLPVWPCEIIVHFDTTGTLVGVDCTHVPTPKVPTVAEIDAEEALANAVKRWPDLAEAKVMEKELIILARLEQAPRLAWKFDLDADEEDCRVLVNAINGISLERYSLHHHADIKGSGTDPRAQQRELNLWEDNGTFYMVDASKSMFDATSQPPNNGQGVIAIYDGAGKEVNDVAFAAGLVSSTSATGPWNGDAVGASWGLSKTFDYFSETHQRNSLDGNGGTIRAIVRYGVNVENAFWHNTTKTMVFGDRETILDVAAHELTHGVTGSIGNGGILDYQFQSGALNESVSDVFAELVELHATGSHDWKLYLSIGGQDQVIRDFATPGNITSGGTPMPSKMSEFWQLDISQDAGGVHINSSIINHCFYMLTAGLTDPLGEADSGKIWYRALTTYLQNQSQFIDMRIACVTSAEEIFGADSRQVQRTKQAFDFVEIFDAPSTPSPSPVPTIQGQDAALFFRWNPEWGGFLMARQESALGDGTGLYIDTIDFPDFKRISVTGDGSLATFVTVNKDLGFVNTLTGEVSFAGLTGNVHSAAMSKDGLHFAMVLLNSQGLPGNELALVNLQTQAEQTIKLVSPTSDGNALDIIKYADSMDFSPNADFLIYDAFAEIPVTGTTPFQGWAMYRYDLAGGSISTVIDLNEGLDFGNPSMGKAHPNLLVFEIIDRATRRSSVQTADLYSGQARAITTIEEPDVLAIPSFTGDDRSIVYSARDNANPTRGSLVQQPLAEDGITPIGNPGLWLADGVFGTIYRRGTFTTQNALPQVAITSPAANANLPAPAVFDFTVSASDADGTIDRVEFYIGSAKVAEDNLAPYTIQLEKTDPGVVRLTARAVDNLGAAGDSAVVEVTVGGGAINQPPTITAITPQNVVQGQTLEFAVQATDQDVPAQTLLYSLAAGAPEGATIGSSNGIFSWTPSAAQGPAVFPITVVVQDDATPPASAESTFQVTVTESQGGGNQTPVLTTIANQTVEQGQTLTFAAQATDADATQELTFSLAAGAPVGAAINGQTGVFTWTPTLVQGPGTFAMTIVVQDNGTPPASAESTFQVTVTESQGGGNQTPVLTTIANQTVEQGQTLTFAAQATDADATQELTFSLAAGAPVGAAINGQTGVFTWTPTLVQGPGTFVMTIVVQDNGTPPASAERTFQVAVTESAGGGNQTPVLTTIANQTVEQGQTLTFAAQATDADATQELTFSLAAGAPVGAAINPQTGVFTWTPTLVQGPGTFVITVVVQDSGTPPASAESTFQVAVTEASVVVNQPPVLASIPNQTIDQGQLLTFTAVATDADAGQQLTFSLEPGSPVGAAINAQTGVFTWTPTSQAQGTFVVSVSVQDDATPPLKVTQNVLITVNEQVATPRPSITLSISTLPNGFVELRVGGGETNDIIQIDAATALDAWGAIATLVVTDGEIRFVDPESATLEGRYYRAHVK